MTQSIDALFAAKEWAENANVRTHLSIHVILNASREHDADAEASTLIEDAGIGEEAQVFTIYTTRL